MNPVTDLSQLRDGDRVLLPLNLLVRSPLNHRGAQHKHPEQDAELRASLRTHGVIENLSGYVDGKQFAITAGGRRLTQLQWLASHDEIASDHAVPCFVHGMEVSTDISLTENIQRLPPHPADIFEAFAALEKQGLSAQAIGNRYGRTEAEVLRFLRLGNVHPTLFKHFRRGAMEYDQIRAYAITADRKEQLRVFKALGSDPGTMVWRIREQFRQSRLSADSKLVKFVTLKAYQKAGGRREVDLFSENEQLLDVDILDTLCEAKIERQRKKLMKEGWKWVEVIFDGHPDWQLQRLTPTSQGVPDDELAPIIATENELKALHQQHEDDWDNESLEQQIATLESELQAMRDAMASRYPPTFSDEQKTHAGVQAFVNAQGRFEIHRGLMRASDARALAQTAASGSESDGQKGGAELSPISQALQADLRIYRNRTLNLNRAGNYSKRQSATDTQLGSLLEPDSGHTST